MQERLNNHLIGRSGPKCAGGECPCREVLLPVVVNAYDDYRGGAAAEERASAAILVGCQGNQGAPSVYAEMLRWDKDHRPDNLIRYCNKGEEQLEWIKTGSSGYYAGIVHGWFACKDMRTAYELLQQKRLQQ